MGYARGLYLSEANARRYVADAGLPNIEGEAVLIAIRTNRIYQGGKQRIVYFYALNDLQAALLKTPGVKLPAVKGYLTKYQRSRHKGHPDLR